MKDFEHFEDHRTHINDQTEEIFANILFLMQGEKWRDMRTTLTPAFTGNKMRQMFELIVEIAEEMTVNMIHEIGNDSNGRWEMKDLFSRYTVDVIATSAFGIKINSMKNPKNEFVAASEKFRNPKGPMKLFWIVNFPRLTKLFGCTFVDQSIADFFKSMILETMIEREKHNISRPDMIDILMQVRKGSLGQNRSDDPSDHRSSILPKRTIKRHWTDNELVAQCLLFFTAGFGTVSSLLSFAAYELALHQEIQKKLYDEIQTLHESLDGKPLSYDALSKLKYVDQVISETLRKWPSSPLVDRQCVKDYSLNVDGKFVEFKKGVGFMIPIYGFHHDPKYFPEPNKFDPERFSEDNKGNIVPGTYIPFGIGPRMCIGNRFALMEAKALLFHLVLKFKLEPNENTEIPLKLQPNFVSLEVLNGIHLSFKCR